MVEVVKVTALYCGQGMCNWLEYYANKTDKDPTALAILDLGGKGELKERAVEFMVARLRGFATGKRVIQLAVISHQDDDHWLLITPFINAVKAANLTDVTITKLWLGGTKWITRSKNAVKKLRDEFKATMANFTTSFTDYGGKNTEILKQGSLRIRVIITNNPCNATSNDLITNGTSAVIAVEMGGHSVILPGDATYETMAAATTIYSQTGPPQPCYGMSVPHHGALRTAVKGYTKDTKIEDMTFTEVDNFITATKPTHIVASAGPLNGHHHPVQELLERFEKYVVDSDAEHYLQTFNFDRDKWDIIERSIPVWTTVSYNYVPPPDPDPEPDPMILAMVGGKKRKRKSEEPTSDYQMYSKNVEYTLESTGAVAIREVVITPLTAAARAPATRVAPPPTAKEIEAYAVRIAHAAG